MSFFIFLFFVVSLSWSFHLINSALPISRNMAQIRRYGIRTKGQVTSIHCEWKVRYVTVLHVTYVYSCAGKKLTGEQDIRTNTPLSMIQRNHDVDVLYLADRPWISRLANCEYAIAWKYVMAAIALFPLLVISLMMIIGPMLRN